MSSIVAWLKIFSMPGSPVEFVVNAEGFLDDEPPTDTTRSLTEPCLYYTVGEIAEVRFPGVGPGAIKLGGAYYTVTGALVYDPSGTAQANVFDQIANPT